MKRLRELRKSRGITAKELGHIINVAESTISLYENGKRAPDYVTLLKIANYFDVSTDYLLDRDEGKNGQDQPSASFAKLGQVIKELRQKRGLTLNDMAEDLEISQRTLYDIEQVRAQPTLTMAKHLAEYFDVSIDHLLGREKKEKPAASDELLSDPQNREFLQLYSMLTPEERQFVMAAIKGILSKR